jgi:membrane associated rhomboid family serine protease
MGIYSRDYYRNDQRSWQEQWLTSGCKWLIAANIIVLVAQLLFTREEIRKVQTDQGVLPVQQHVSIVEEALELSPNRVNHGEVWRLVTYAFCHSTGGVMHILFNMLFLAWFGMTLERMYGTREFVLFYFVGALASGLTFYLLALILGDEVPAVGASGAVMAIVMLYAVHFPREEIFLLGLIRVQIRFLVLFYVAYDLFPVLAALGGSNSSDGVAHSAHLGGLAFGFAYHHFGLRLDRLSAAGLGRLRSVRSKIRAARRPESIRIYEPPPRQPAANLEQQVDAILEKMFAHGEASLTDSERELLKQASERYKGNPRSR